VVSFRFHLVSLVAVFMALGLGILAGTTVINRGIVARLEEQTADLDQRTQDLEADVVRLQSEAEVWSAYGEETMDLVLNGRLDGSDLVVVTQDGTDDASIDGVLRALRMAIGDEEQGIVGPFSVTTRMVLGSEADRTELAAILGSDPAAETETLQAEAASQLAQRLAFGAEGDDTLEELLAARFLVDEGPEISEAALSTVGGTGQAVVVLAGGPADSSLRPESFLVPLVADLAADGSTVVAGEPVNGQEEEPPFVTALRTDGEVSTRIATQDNVDQLPGQVGLVLALEDLLRGIAGHYGVKDGADGPIPEV
jgi:Copper transport outer membrane protein, MctB